MRVLLLLLAVLGSALRAEEDAARAIFRKAVQAQGKVTRAQIRDVNLRFNGQIVEEGSHHITREYWYRSGDKSFRVLTEPKAAKKTKSERGVLGRNGYWERTAAGAVVTLRGGNREHAATVRTIVKDRRDFERVLEMVLLARLEAAETTYRLAFDQPVHLKRDLPYEANGILGKNRDEQTYHVLDIVPKKGHRMRLFIHTGDYTVRKAVLFERGRTDWIYYLGYYKTDKTLGLTLPRYFSVHRGLPVDPKTKKSTAKAYGEIKLRINRDLKDADLRPKS